MPPKRRLSETSDGQESLGAGGEDEAITGEEEERVKAGPGRPKKKKVDPSQQLQVLYNLVNYLKSNRLSSSSWCMTS